MLRCLAFALIAAFGALFGPGAFAQQTGAPQRVAYLGPPSPPTLLHVLRQELATRGLTDGREIVIETHWPAGGDLERLPEVATALASGHPDVIVAIGATAARAAVGATRSIPIIYEVVVDPVATGLVADRTRPGGNATGFTSFDPQQSLRQLQLLKEALPQLSRIAFIGDTGAAAGLFKVNEDAARAAGLESQTYKVERSPNPDFGSVLDQAKNDGAGAVVVISTPVTTPNRKVIVELASRHRLPTLSPRDHEDAAPLLSYGTTFLESTRRAAGYVEKVLRGAKPGDLPVQTVSAPDFIVNLNTARALGITVPQAVLRQATRVVD